MKVGGFSVSLKVWLRGVYSILSKCVLMSFLAIFCVFYYFLANLFESNMN